jgi:hypothetical protein
MPQFTKIYKYCLIGGFRGFNCKMFLLIKTKQKIRKVALSTKKDLKSYKYFKKARVFLDSK